MKKLRLGLLIGACFLSMTAFAGTPNPQTMLTATTDKLLATLKQNRATLKRNPKYIYQIVNKILLPHVDVIAMSQSALGRRGWLGATIPQRKKFTKAFTVTVIKTYSSALNAYTDETIRYFPLRGGFRGKKVLRIRSQIMRASGPPISMIYGLILRKTTWKIYDLNVEGVSLLQSFRSQFSAQLAKGWGVAKVITHLEKHNTKMK
jgi:phospholipid transport system substrate-binding protein